MGLFFRKPKEFSPKSLEKKIKAVKGIPSNQKNYLSQELAKFGKGVTKTEFLKAVGNLRRDYLISQPTKEKIKRLVGKEYQKKIKPLDIYKDLEKEPPSGWRIRPKVSFFEPPSEKENKKPEKPSYSKGRIPYHKNFDLK